MATSSKVLIDTDQKYVVQITNQFTSATPETAVVKIDKSTLTGPDGTEPDSLVVESITGEVAGCNITIYADRTSPITIAELGGMAEVNLQFKSCNSSGLQTKGSGGSGDILLTSLNQASGDSYNLIITCRKRN